MPVSRELLEKIYDALFGALPNDFHVQADFDTSLIIADLMEGEGDDDLVMRCWVKVGCVNGDDRQWFYEVEHDFGKPVVAASMPYVTGLSTVVDHLITEALGTVQVFA